MTGAEFKELRNKYGLSANQVARLLKHNSGRSIRRIEANGPTNATADHWIKTIKLYELTGEWKI